MANLKQTDLLKLDKLLGFSSGYVLHFTNSTFASFFQSELNINIYNSKYEKYGDSKGKRLRAFFELENDKLVGKAILELVECWRTNNMLEDVSISSSMTSLGNDCEKLGKKLSGRKIQSRGEFNEGSSEEEFLNRTFDEIDFNQLNLETRLINVLNQRIKEIQNGLKTNSALSVVFLCGSSLEGILLGIATQNARRFNEAKASPKNQKVEVKKFYDWTLNDFINVAHELGFIGLDVKKHSHALRDFRNYIHPFEQMSQNFNPDQHTAEISWQVFRAALNDLKKVKYN